MPAATTRLFASKIGNFLDANALFTSGAELRGICLHELRTARKTSLLTGGGLDPKALAQQAGAFAAFADPQAVLAAEVQAVDRVADELRQAGFTNLGPLLASRSPQGLPSKRIKSFFMD